MHEYTPEAAQAIESNYREFAHRLRVDWNNNGKYNHPLSDMTKFVTRSSREQALSSTAPEEVMLIEGYTAASLDIELSGDFNGLPIAGHFAPYNSRSVFYVEGIQLGVQMTYEIAIATDAGWEWYPQFTGMVREVNTDRRAGEVVLTCLDNAERMRTPVLIPPYAAYQDYLVNGYKRSGLVDSSSVIDLAARVAGFDNSPRGYWSQHKTYQGSDGLYGKKIALSVPFHGSMLPEIGALDNEFEFHLTEEWVNGTAAEKARAEQYRSGPDFAGNGLPYLACNAVPRGKNVWITKKYWMDTYDYVTPSAAWGTTVLGTWIYWTGSGVDEDSRVITVEYYDVMIDLNVRSSDRGVYPILRTGKKDPGGSHTATYTGPLMFLPTDPGWHYIEVAVNISPDQDAMMRTMIDGTSSAPNTAPYRLPASAEYALGGLVTVENKYALSDLFVFRNQFREFITNNDKYDLTSRSNVKSIGHLTGTPDGDTRWGRNRFMYTLRDDTQESWDIVKGVAAAEFGVVFFDEEGDFNFWNYDTVARLQQGEPVRKFTLDEVENLSLRLTMDSVRNVWRVTTRTAEAAPGITYDLAKDGAPRKDSDNTLPAVFQIPENNWIGFMIPDNDHVISTHPYLTLRPVDMLFDEYAPWEGYKTYRGTTYVGDQVAFYPRKSGPYWTKLVCFGTFDVPNTTTGVDGFVGPDDRAFFRLRGTMVQENEPRSFEVRNDASVADYGQRVLEMSNNFWLQDRFQTESMLSRLVSKLGRPIPVTDAITVPGDPRIQIGDVIEIADPDGFGGSIKLQIFGILRELEDGVGLVDTYQVEVVQQARVWILGDQDYSILGQSTVLS
ncbi:hypothetical protein [Saccharopolyspora pogona]|uniref:hypothetical protein n=1 Tax=Saccharopolyspora pogona TaxID=333966 RepID=UPI001686FEEB|nr:hypothetical protein [Saccharopolyspora pogona]